MTRDEVIEGLTVLLVRSDLDWTLRGWHDADTALVREALALLTPPTTSEITAARTAMHGWQFRSDERGRWSEVYEKALDALAREPATETVLHRKNVRIATLESRLARVREVVAQMPEGDACYACRTALAEHDAEDVRP